VTSYLSYWVTPEVPYTTLRYTEPSVGADTYEIYACVPIAIYKPSSNDLFVVRSRDNELPGNNANIGAVAFQLKLIIASVPLVKNTTRVGKTNGVPIGAKVPVIDPNATERNGSAHAFKANLFDIISPE